MAIESSDSTLFVTNCARNRLALAVAIVITSLMASGVNAAPLEINQTCATGPDGCFTGDASGFPVEITSPGSYVLTGDLAVSGPDTDGILLNTLGGVKVDLRGHTVRGPIVCVNSGGLLSCGSGNGIGISMSGLPARLHLTNGRITGFGQAGVDVGDLSRIDHLVVSRNATTGIEFDSLAIVSHVVAENNAAHGTSGTQGLLFDVSASSNRSAGLFLFQSLVEKTAAQDNGGTGLLAGDHVLVRDATLRENSNGLLAQSANCLILDSDVTENIGAGFSSFGSGSIQRTTIRGNGSFGLVGVGVTYRANTFSNNASGNVGLTAPPAINLGDNACSGAICP